MVWDDFAKCFQRLPSLFFSETNCLQKVGFYFAADRYPVCKKFAIQLAATYNIVKDKGLEIVFCSSDRTIEDFNHFRSEMPWLALPFDAKEKVMALKNAIFHHLPATIYYSRCWDWRYHYRWRQDKCTQGSQGGEFSMEKNPRSLKLFRSNFTKAKKS